MSHFYIPGFLGKVEDEIICPPLFQADSLEEWALQFNQFAATFPAPRTLIGYSMGGRLALHALIASPELYEQAVLVSTHPGLKKSIERSERYINDLRWAERFLHGDWESLMAAWDAQPVFQGSVQQQRPEAEFDRNVLSHQLNHYSLGLQRDLRSEIAKLNVPTAWVAGALDHKFCSLMDEIAGLNPMIQTFRLQNVGHRISFQLILEHVLDKLPQRLHHGKMAHSQKI
jgi:2-succinyl-6-hydroxy-2,4-cyclohexadiene-1-carboxylate synthase